MLPWCYPIYHTLCQNSSTSDLFGIIYTSTRNTEINNVFLFKKGHSVIDYQLVTETLLVAK